MTHIYSVPEGKEIYPGYTASVDGKALPVLQTRCSAIPFNRRWPGHQRQIEQSELCGFVRFWFEGEATLTVTADRDFEKAEIRPSSKNVELHRDGRTLTFTITRPGGYSLELDGYHNNLHIFADKKPEYDIDINDENVLYYGPGYHEAGIVQLRSHQTVYIDEGAVVYACFHARDCEDISIIGRGIIDNSHNVEEILFEMDELGDGSVDVHNSKREHTVYLLNCNNILLDGFTICDSLVYNVGLWGCNNIEIKDLKIIGCWRYNSDGIDLHNCTKGHISGCFARTFDDTICYKAHNGYQNLCEDIVTENCVVWCDWDHCLEFGAECRADYMRRLTFKNIDVIHSLDTAMSICNVDFGTVTDALYEDIRVEYDDLHQKPQLQSSDESEFEINTDKNWLPLLISVCIFSHHEYSSGLKERGHVNNVTYRNIQVRANTMPPIQFIGFDNEHKVENVTIDGLYLNGKKTENLEQANARMNEFVDNIIIK